MSRHNSSTNHKLYLRQAWSTLPCRTASLGICSEVIVPCTRDPGTVKRPLLWALACAFLIRGACLSKFELPGISTHYIFDAPTVDCLRQASKTFTVMKYSLIAGLLAVAGTNCTPTSHIESETVNVENLRTVPQGWTAIGAPASHHKLPFRIAVRSVRQFIKLLINKNACQC